MDATTTVTHDERAFIPSPTFAGPRPGFAFKKGPAGVGDYINTIEGTGTMTLSGSSNADEAAGNERRTISLDLLVPLPVHEARTDAFLTDVQKAQRTCHGGSGQPRKRRAARRGKGSTTSFEVTIETQTADREHRAAGLWAIDSVNPNAWPAAEAYLEMTSADAVLVQEARRKKGQTDAAENSALRIGWAASIQPAVTTFLGRASAGVAVAVRKHVGMARTPGSNMDAGCGPRVQARWVGAMVKGGVVLVSAYLFPAEGLTQRNLDLLQEIAELLQSLDAPWVLAADFNMEPDVLAASRWPALVGGVIFAPGAATCGTATNDYFVVHEKLASAVAGVSVVADAGLHTHRPARLHSGGGTAARRSPARCSLQDRRRAACWMPSPRCCGTSRRRP